MQIDFGIANPALFRLMSDPERVLDSPAARAGRQVLEARVHRIALTGRLRVSERRAVDLIQAAGVGAILTVLTTAPALRDVAVADDLYAAVLDRIATADRDHADDTGGGPKAPAVALRAIAPRLDMLSTSERQLLTEWLDRAIDAL